MSRFLFPLALCAVVLAGDDHPTLTTENGVRIEILRPGKAGTEPGPGDKVRVHYTGRLKDGTKFDSSYDRRVPFTFTLGVGGVIRGWEEALPHLTVGSKAQVTIPWKLAYGERGQGKIPPKADLIFEIELLRVTKGRPLPRFRALDPEKTKTTASGLKYELLNAGGGDAPGPDAIVRMRFFVWNAGGDLIACTEQRGRFIAGPVSALRLEFLKEAARLLRPGGSALFEVPPKLAWGSRRAHPKLPPDSTTIWYLGLEEIVTPPAFRALDAAKTRKTASGLKYEVIEEGAGDHPGPKGRVRVHYAGWLQNGKEFDSSYKRGQPVEFTLDRVIAGWREGLQLMRPGAVYLFEIPPELGYGAQARGPIPGGATLVFRVQLLAVLE